jgi:hypothetical protein
MWAALIRCVVLTCFQPHLELINLSEIVYCLFNFTRAIVPKNRSITLIIEVLKSKEESLNSKYIKTPLTQCQQQQLLIQLFMSHFIFWTFARAPVPFATQKNANTRGVNVRVVQGRGRTLHSTVVRGITTTNIALSLQIQERRTAHRGPTCARDSTI